MFTLIVLQASKQNLGNVIDDLCQSIRGAGSRLLVLSMSPYVPHLFDLPEEREENKQRFQGLEGVGLICHLYI
jgi:hypothetical protein